MVCWQRFPLSVLSQLRAQVNRAAGLVNIVVTIALVLLSFLTMVFVVRASIDAFLPVGMHPALLQCDPYPHQLWNSSDHEQQHLQIARSNHPRSVGAFQT